MVFPQIDTNDIKKVTLELCNPKKETIGILKEAYNINLSIKAMQINTLEFCLPLHIDYYGEKISNPHLEDMRPYYLIRMTVGDYKEYFRIAKPKDEGGDEDYKFYYCMSYISTLADRQLISYSAMSYTIREVFNGKPSENMAGILAGTNWSIKKKFPSSELDIDPEFDDKYRSVESGSTNILDFILDNLVKAYNCLPVFDTETNEISIYAPGNVGKNTGLSLSYRKYIETFGLELDNAEFTTRLNVRGKDGMSIQDVTPSGQPYLENFTYFMQGFEQDEHGNVISHSPYWSDELCIAQLAYQELLEEKEGIFEGYLNSKNSINQSIKEKEAELEILLQSLHQTQEIVTILNGGAEQYYYREFDYDGSPISETTKLNNEFKYVCMGMTTNANITLKLDDTTISMQKDTWKVLGKLSGKKSCKIQLSGGVSANVIIVIAKIFDTEYEETDEFLIDKYCEPKKDKECQDKIAEIESLTNSIAQIETDIDELENVLSSFENFSPELLEERNRFVIEKTFENNNITDSRDLLESAVEYFEEVNSPALVLDLSLVNFLDMATDDTDRLFYDYNITGLYDKITVRYEPFGVNVKCMIMEINLDVENSTLDFTLSNVRDISAEEKFLKDMGATSSATTNILQEKYKWDDATDSISLVKEILEGAWDAATREIRAGANEDVVIDRAGITVTDPTNPKNVVRIVSGWIGLSKDSGKSFKTAINAEGVNASQLVGMMIAGENLVITNETGTFEVNRDGVVMDGLSLTIGGGLPSAQIKNAAEWDAKETPDGAQEKANAAEEAAKDYADKNVVYKVEIFSTQGVVFKNQQVSTILIARVYKGKVDVTDEIDANYFIWTRISDDPEADFLWNQSHAGGRKQLEITYQDVGNRATFSCEIQNYLEEE